MLSLLGRAVGYSIVHFLNAAALFVLLGAEFLAMLLIIVYVGAIAVLFLFVVMMLNIKLAEINEKRLRYLPVGGVLGLLFLFEILLIVDHDLIPQLQNTSGNVLGYAQGDLAYQDWMSTLATRTNIQAIGDVLYTYYFYYFLMASLVLLIAMIGAIVLTMQKSITIKRQQVFLQNTRDFGKTIRKVS